MGTPTDPAQLLKAAKLAITLMDMIHDAFWSLYPDEILALTQDDEHQLTRLLAEALAGLTSDAAGLPDHPTR